MFFKTFPFLMVLFVTAFAWFVGKHMRLPHIGFLSPRWNRRLIKVGFIFSLSGLAMVITFKNVSLALATLIGGLTVLAVWVACILVPFPNAKE